MAFRFIREPFPAPRPPVTGSVETQPTPGYFLFKHEVTRRDGSKYARDSTRAICAGKGVRWTPVLRLPSNRSLRTGNTGAGWSAADLLRRGQGSLDFLNCAHTAHCLDLIISGAHRLSGPGDVYPFIEAEKRRRRNVKRARAAEGLPCRLLRPPGRTAAAGPGRCCACCGDPSRS
jgi:hypothetical protein